jgi:hypothetical protein
MRIYIPHHLPLSTCLSTVLIIATGGCFAFLCMIMILSEFVIKLIVIPVVFLFAMTCLAYGFVQRKIFQPVQGTVPVHS